jgi:hypothetical protein
MPPNAGNLLCQFHLQIACDPMRSTILQDALSPSAKRLHHCSISPTAWPFYSAKSHNCRSQSADIAVNIIRFTKAVKAFRCFKTFNIFWHGEKPENCSLREYFKRGLTISRCLALLALDIEQAFAYTPTAISILKSESSF